MPEYPKESPENEESEALLGGGTQPTQGAMAFEPQVAYARGVECRRDSEQKQPKNDGENVRDPNIRPPETLPQALVDLLWLPPPRFAGAVIGLFGFRHAARVTRISCR